jgi:hypothetical protein
METLEIKSYETNMDRIHFYGECLIMIVVNSSIRNIDTLFNPLFLFNIFTTRPSGHPLWTLLSHVTLPLTLFYRFHSASCLVDIWKSAYEAPEQQCWTQLERKKKTVKNFKCERLAEKCVRFACHFLKFSDDEAVRPDYTPYCVQYPPFLFVIVLFLYAMKRIEWREEKNDGYEPAEIYIGASCYSFQMLCSTNIYIHTYTYH